MSEMVERVAKAMEAAAEAGPGEIYEGGGWIDTPAWKTLARAAIAAMREPTDLMVAAGLWVDGNPPDVVYQQMIDAALANTDATAVASAPDAVVGDDSTLPTLDDVRGILRGYEPDQMPCEYCGADPAAPRFYATKTADGGWDVMDSQATVKLFGGLDRSKADAIVAVLNKP